MPKLSPQEPPSGPSRCARQARPHEAGFSLVELLLGVVMVAVLATIAVMTLGNSRSAARRIALEGDVNMMNKAVHSYLGAGGVLRDVTDPTAVLAKLKTTATAEQSPQIAGLKGPFVDLRLELVPATSKDAWSLQYDPATTSFRISPDQTGFVTKINEALATVPVVTETRQVSLRLATEDSWVWNYAKTPAGTRAAPSRPSSTDAPSATPSAPSDVPAPLQLNPPTFSRSGFQLGPNDFPHLLTLTNPNPTGTSEIMFRINGGSYMEYETGLSLPLQASTVIEAYASPLQRSWRPSNHASETFTFQPGQLLAPTITPASGSFSYDEFPTTLSLQDTNPAGTALLQYRLGSGTWMNYSVPVALTRESGLEVKARAIPVDSQRWVASQETSARYELLQQLLKAPVFTKAAGMYPATDYPLNVAITNPNPPESSTLQYREKGTTVWQNYSTAISISYTQLDLTLEARAVPIDSVKWISSPVRPSRYQLVKSGLNPPVVTPPGGYYPYANFPSVVTIENPNPAETSSLWYRFGTTGEFLPYDAANPPTLSKEQYQTTLMAYARTKLPAQFIDSSPVTETYETIYFVGNTKGFFHDPTPDTTTGGTAAKLVTNLPAPKEGELFKWGSTSGTGLSQSTMQFAGSSFKAAPGEWFLLGKLDYYNGTIVTGSGAGGVKLKFAFSISQPDATTTNADYPFKLINTKNTGTEADNADYVYLPTLGVPFASTVGGRSFKLDVRFGETTANGFSSVSEFHIYEQKSATGSLYGRITEVP